MKDIEKISYVICTKIHKEISQNILGLSQETYINNVLKRFSIKYCSPNVTPIVKSNKLGFS